MAVIANILLKDSANANKTYVPEKVQTGAYASWVNRDQGTSVGNKRAYLQTRQQIGKYEKRTGKIVHPRVDALTGLAAFTNSIEFNSQIDERSTLAEKQELMYSFAAFIGLSPIQLNVTTGEAVSG
mgnify:CR=1 FL=1